jgi:hypothetical protein
MINVALAILLIGCKGFFEMKRWGANMAQAATEGRNDCHQNQAMDTAQESEE